MSANNEWGIIPDPSKWVIFDVDGTLMDIRERRKFVEQKPKDWNSFNNHKNVMMDKPFDAVFLLAKTLQEAGFGIILSSGRKQSLETITLQQVEKEGLSPDMWFFRSETDFRPDNELKASHLNKIRAEGIEPIMAFDDRDSVVDFWRSEGIKTFQPERGNF